MPDEPKSDDNKIPPLSERSPILRGTRMSHALMKQYRMYDRVLPAAFLLGVLVALAWYVAFAAPAGFQAPTIVKVTPDMTLASTTQAFAAADTVRSPELLKILLRVLGANKTVEAGSYFFAGPQNLLTVALRLAHGDFELVPARITVHEGETAAEIATDLSKHLAPFDTASFLAIALPREGYLYPDTYYFLPGEDPLQVEDAMEKDFADHIAPIEPSVLKFGQPVPADVIMASILVGEAATDKDRRTVAGILWRRLQLGMPLQVDATFGYVLDKNLTELTGADIRTDSPYNTYLNKGLPPTAIGSPGAEAILQAVTPIKTNYLYYLSDKHGTMHYSATYAGQLANVKRYYGT